MKNITFIVLLLSFIANISLASGVKQHTPEEYGAVGNGISDDTQALTKAFNSGYDIYFNSAKTYKITNTIIVKSISKKVIDLKKSTITRDPTKIGFSFLNCTSVVFRGGNIICTSQPHEGKGSENCINYIQCKNIATTHMHINGSNEMGIAHIECIDVTSSYNKVENCFRDGIHEIYCANVKVFGNNLTNIKDDALACHDYGTDAQKTFLISNGYPQASNIEIYNNVVTNAYQGISSISCKNVEIKNNIISNTVGAGIDVINTQAINISSTERVNGAKIENNQVSSSCTTQKIMGISYANGGQNSTGRAAIFVGSLGANGQISSAIRLSNVSVTGNTVTNGGINGLWFSDTDNAILSGNLFTNCCIETSNFSGTVCALYRLTNAYINNNKTVDNRVTKKHYFGFDIQTVTGNIINLTDVGSKAGYNTVSAPDFNKLKQ
jgi:hypothetical protein